MSHPAKPICADKLRAYIQAGGTPKGFAADFGYSRSHVWKCMSDMRLGLHYLTPDEWAGVQYLRKQRRAA